jgi:nicotinate dehydrogenase subunit A
VRTLPTSTSGVRLQRDHCFFADGNTSHKLRVNGLEHVFVVAADTPLLYVLRNDLALNGPKFGCGLAQCGACAVLKNGREIRSRVAPVAMVAGSEITTSEGLGTPDRLHPLQAAFVEKQAAQCGYRTSGVVIAAVDLLRANPKPTEEEIKRHMDGHLCRCGTHPRIIEAIATAARAGVPI